MHVLSQVPTSEDVDYCSQNGPILAYRLFVIDSCTYGEEKPFLPS